jgi:hypothetical protein
MWCARKGAARILRMKRILTVIYYFHLERHFQESCNLPKDFYPLIKAVMSSALPLFIPNACIYWRKN